MVTLSRVTIGIYGGIEAHCVFALSAGAILSLSGVVFH